MWLLNTSTRELEHFVDETQKYGRYAILSHTWDKDEISFQDVQSGRAEKMPTYTKVDWICRQALEDRLDYAWVDTCCIDKTSSAELSEANNSMFRWYSQAKVCYAYLSDYPECPLAKAKWFTRGWTLQELIAPAYVVFYDQNWVSLGTKFSMLEELAKITRIDEDVLAGRAKLSSVSVAGRMAWAAKRVTSRVEDRAYSLLGIFDVSMPMLYGEGIKSYVKLQEEIINRSTDHSILAWQPWKDCQRGLLFSPSPYGFRHAHKVASWSSSGIDDSFQLSNRGLRISLPVVRNRNRLFAILNCQDHQEANSADFRIALLLYEQSQAKVVPARTANTTICNVARHLNSSAETHGFPQLVDHRCLPSLANWIDMLIPRELSSSKILPSDEVFMHRVSMRSISPDLHFSNAAPGKICWTDPHPCMLLVNEAPHESAYGFVRYQYGKKLFTLGFGVTTRSGRPALGVRLMSGSNAEGLVYSLSTQSEILVSSKGRIGKDVGEKLCATSLSQSPTAVIGESNWVIELSIRKASNTKDVAC